MNDARVIFEQTAFQSFRDPTAYFKGDICYLYFTLVQNESDGQYFYIAESHSDNLKNWSEIRILTKRSKSLNFSSPGNVFYHNGYYYMCLQTYPRENGEIYGNENSRIFLMKSTDLLNWSEPEIIMVKGNIPIDEMGRMIDPYILKDNDKFICFFKQNGVSYSVSKDLENWEFMGSTDCGENVSVIKQNDEYLIFHSPKNGIGLLKTKDLKSFDDCGVTTLNQEKYPWAKDRITAGFVIEHNNKTYLFFHGDNEDNYLFGASIAVIEDFNFIPN